MAEIDLENLKPEDIKIPGAPEPPVDPAKKDDPDPAKKDDPDPSKKDPADPAKKDDPDPSKKDPADPAKKDDPDPAKKDPADPAKKDEELGLVKAKKEEPKEDEGNEGEIDFGNLSEITGLEVDSAETLVSSLKELKELRSLSPALKKAIEIEKNKGDVAAYFRNVFDDPDKLSEGEALWRSYEKTNPKLVAGDRDFARLDFERTMKKEYSLLVTYNSLPADEKEAYLKEHKDDIEYEKKKYEMSVRNARASLKESQKEATFFEPGVGIIEAEMQETLKKHEQESDRALSDFDSIAIGVDDELDFKIGINDANGKLVKQWIKKPETFMNKLGIGNDGIDYNTLLGYMTLIADIETGNFGKEFKKSILSAKDIKTLEEDINGAKPIKRAEENLDGADGDMFDQVGKKIVEAREAKSKR